MKTIIIYFKQYLQNSILVTLRGSFQISSEHCCRFYMGIIVPPQILIWCNWEVDCESYLIQHRMGENVLLNGIHVPVVQIFHIQDNTSLVSTTWQHLKTFQWKHEPSKQLGTFHQGAWCEDANGTGFSKHSERNSSKSITVTFFAKHFQWKGLFHLFFYQKNGFSIQMRPSSHQHLPMTRN